MARADAANELDALKAQLADFALRHAAEAIAKDPKKFLSSDVMKAVEAAALAAVEARLAKEPRPSPEDFAAEVMAQIRPELNAAAQGLASAAPRGARVTVAETGIGGLLRELSRHWATVFVAVLLIAAVGGAFGWMAGQGFARADAERAAARPTPDTESTDGLVVTNTPPAKADAAPAAPPAGGGPAAGTDRPQQ